MTEPKIITMSEVLRIQQEYYIKKLYGKPGLIPRILDRIAETRIYKYLIWSYD